MHAPEKQGVSVSGYPYSRLRRLETESLISQPYCLEAFRVGASWDLWILSVACRDFQMYAGTLQVSKS